jgi:hypothetical protein
MEFRVFIAAVFAGRADVATDPRLKIALTTSVRAGSCG